MIYAKKILLILIFLETDLNQFKCLLLADILIFFANGSYAFMVYVLMPSGTLNAVLPMLLETQLCLSKRTGRANLKLCLYNVKEAKIV